MPLRISLPWLGIGKRQSTKAAEPCPFLDILPYEIRLQIYGHLLTDPAVVSAWRHTVWRLWPTAPYPQRWSAILATNRQIHDEAAPVLYGTNTFYMPDLFYPMPDDAVRNIFRSGCRYSKLVKKFVTWTKYEAPVDRDKARKAVQTLGFDWANITMVAIWRKEPEIDDELWMTASRTLVDWVDWQKLQRRPRPIGDAERVAWQKWSEYAILDEHSEWLDDGGELCGGFWVSDEAWLGHGAWLVFWAEP